MFFDMKKIVWFLCFVLVALLSACGGGGSSSADTYDERAPVFMAAATDEGGLNIILSYDENLSTITARPADFVVLVNGTAVDVKSVSVSGKDAILSLARVINPGETVLASYVNNTLTADTSNPAIQDAAGNDSVLFTNYAVTNKVLANLGMSIQIDGVDVVLNSQAGYPITAGSRLTIKDPYGRLGGYGLDTVSSTGNFAYATFTPVTSDPDTLDIIWRSGPSGGVTTFSLTMFKPTYSINLLWR